MVRPILTYFDLTGKGEAIRLCLFIGGIDFEDRRVPDGDISYKKESPTGSLPLLEVNGRKYVDTAAILMYVARLTDLAVSDQNPLDVLRLSTLVHFTVTMWDPVAALRTAPPHKRIEMAVDAIDILEPKLHGLERLLNNKPVQDYAVGDKLTVADITIFVWAESLRHNPVGVSINDLHLKYPTISRIAEKVRAHPKVQEWLRTRPSSN